MSMLRALTSVLLLFSGLAVTHAELVDFARHVSPTLYKLGCSSGSCHGSFSGKGGFQLSLFASRPELDYANIRTDGFGRRIDLLRPEESLLLRKPTASMPHGGGQRLKKDSPEYQLLLSWIESGASYDATRANKVVGVRVEPANVTIRPGADPQAIGVLAKLSDGREEDVTKYTKFEPRDPSIADIDLAGNISGQHPGDTPILAHYAGKVAYTIVAVPGEIPEGIEQPEEEYTDRVDQLLADKLKRLGIVPSATCTDAEFIRRAYLDALSVLPTPDQVQAFLADKSPDKRAKLIDALLSDPLHHALWATKFSDLLGADNRFLNPVPFHDWFRNKLERDVPWDQIAHGILCATKADGRSLEELRIDLALDSYRSRQNREIKKAQDALLKAAKARLAKDKPETAKEPDDPAEEAKKEDQKEPELTLESLAGPGPPEPPLGEPWHRGSAARRSLDELYSCLKYQQQIRDENGKTVKRFLDSKMITLQLSSALLGLQLTCAQCHKHPYDKWTQRDFFGFTSVFTHVHKGLDPDMQKLKIKLNGVFISIEPLETFDDPESDQPVKPSTLGGDPIELTSGSDPRQAVYDWMVKKENPYFARAIVNRVWAHYFQRGLFEPVDSQSAANPPSHPEVLDELVREFVAHGYELSHLHRRILNLVAYGRSWRTNATNEKDERNFSHRVLRRMTAEQVVDSISQITGTPLALTKVYSGEMREGARMIELSMSRFRGDDWHVLKIFGKPLRVQACDCERSTSGSLSQALYLYNDESLMKKLSDENGRLKKLVEEIADDKQLLQQWYLWTLSRLPTEEEVARDLEYLKQAESRLIGYQDIVWALLNRKEFVVSH